MKKEWTATLVFVVTLAILFIVASYFTHKYLDFIQYHMSGSVIGVIVYFLAIIAETVFAPISIIPLIPIASGTWGWLLAGTITLVGWTLGSVLALIIGRRYGTPFLKERESYKKIKKIEELIPDQHIFLGIVLLRITIPSDLVSYGLGIFSRVSWQRYLLATFVGYAPMSFILCYLGTFPFKLQITLVLIGSVLILSILHAAFKNKKFRDELKGAWEKKFKKPERKRK